jgi:hypothetical protein
MVASVIFPHQLPFTIQMGILSKSRYQQRSVLLAIGDRSVLGTDTKF